MSKRRRGERQVHHQVPSLRQLATRAVQRNEGAHFAHNARAWRGRINMDVPMSTASTGNSNADAAKQVGQGLGVTIPRNVPNSYNNNYTVQLNYADNYRHDVANNGAATATQLFRMNGIFDPDYTGTGHQPFFRDMWASQYDYFAVLKCDYSIRMYNANAEAVTYTAVGTNAQRIGAVNVVQFLGTTNASDVSSAANGLIYPAAEMKNTNTYLLEPEGVLEFRGSLTQGDFMVDAKDADSDQTWVAVGSNPTVGRVFGYAISPAQWAAIVGISEASYSAIIVQVVLNYTVQFTQVNQALRSVSS